MSNHGDIYHKKDASSSIEGEKSSRGNQDFAAKRLSKTGPEDWEKTLKNDERYKLNRNKDTERFLDWQQDQHKRILSANSQAGERQLEAQSQEQQATSSVSPKAETYHKAFMGTLKSGGLP